MYDRTGNNHASSDRILGCLHAAERRLAGGWDDPMAWRILCEELAAAWSGHPSIAWSLVLAREGLVPVAVGADPAPPLAVLWSASGGRPRWCELAGEPAFWAGLAAAPGRLLAGQGPPPLAGPPRPEWDGQTAHWLACGVPGRHGPDLALIVGCSNRDAATDDPADRDMPGEVRDLAAELGDACSLLAPLLGLHRRLTDLATCATAARSESEALSRLGELRARLAAVTAHELKTPLTSIMAYAEVLEQQIGQPGFSHAGEFLRVIRGEADRLLRLVDRLLDSSRRGRGPALTDPQPLIAGPLIEEARRIMAPQAAARDLQLGVHVPDGVPRVEGDADLLRQVLLNLLGNALKFTPPGGRVTISAREETSTVRLAVSDSGPGIAPQELRAIFQSFYRTRAASRTEGVGLGLSIVKEIVNLHGGHLDVHSRQGRGATFGVHLPKEQQFATTETALTAAGTDPLLQQRLAGHTLRLVAELAAARGVALLLPAAEHEVYVAAASSGLGHQTAGIRLAARGEPLQSAQRKAQLLSGGRGMPPEVAGLDDSPGSAMLAPLRLGERAEVGVILAARRLGGGAFGDDDLLLLRTLAEILGKAWSAALASGVERRVQETVTEALAALTGLRRSGVPTADPLALRVLTRTGRRLGQSTFEVRLLQYAGALHDAGMVLLDPDVLHKPTELDLDERDHIGRHPQRGLDLLGPLVALPQLQAIIRHHHERVDGLGYPEGRRGEAIPLGSRILAVVDAFFAMIRSRPWREGLPVAAAVSEIQRHAGSQFDERVVDCFLATLLEEGLLTPASLGRTVGGRPER